MERKERDWHKLYSHPVYKVKPPEIKCDVVIIGGGPNGLTAGAYLAKAGQKVIIVDRRNELGGGAATEEATIQAGFRHNVHAVYFMMADYAPVYKDLELETKYEVRHIYPSLQFVMPFADGKSLSIYSDPDLTCKSIEKFSKHDAKSYRDLFERSRKMVDEFIAPATYAPPLPALEAVVKMQTSDIGREIMEFSDKSPKMVVDEYFENERVKGLMLYTFCMWGLDPTQTGVGYLIPLYVNRSANYRLVAHGSHTLPQEINKVFLENGGHSMAPYYVKRVIVENGEAQGVELEHGPIIKARAVLSTVDTSQTFLKLVGEANLDKEFVESTKGWLWEHWSLLGTHLALEEAPHFACAKDDPEINKALVYVLGYESDEDFISHYEAIGRGENDGKIGFNCCFPSVHDSTQAPAGRHTGLLSQMAPFELKDGGKDRWFPMRYKEEQGWRCIKVLQRYAPNLTDDKIRAVYVSTPLDVEDKYLNMVRGSIKQGQYHPLQMGYMRPNEFCSNHRSPVKNLFMGGSCTYPGGTVIFGSGYLAANAVAEDLGIKKWWKEPEKVTRAKKKGLL